MKFEHHSPSWLAYTHSCGAWIPARHIMHIEKSILKELAMGGGRIIVNMPPRHGKSEYISKYFPAWFLISNPDKRVILCSYEASFAAEWGRKVRDIISGMADSTGIGINPSKKAADNFLIKDHGGSMICSGAGGSITGRGADLIIIDDPVKNDAEANSRTIRDNIWNWFRATIYTRLEPGATPDTADDPLARGRPLRTACISISRTSGKEFRLPLLQGKTTRLAGKPAKRSGRNASPRTSLGR